MILREEDDGGRVMVMSMNECDQETEQRSGYGDIQVERWRESLLSL